MKLPEIRKQISIFVPLSDWRAIRAEAFRLRIPITELCRRWMQPGMDRLRARTRSQAATAETGFSSPAADPPADPSRRSGGRLR